MRLKFIIIVSIIGTMLIGSISISPAQAGPFVTEGYPEGMISYWKFDEGLGSIASDSFGDNDGMIFGSTWSIGQVGNALSFNYRTGSPWPHDEVNIFHHSTLNTIEMTWELWAKPNTADEVSTPLLSKYKLSTGFFVRGVEGKWLFHLNGWTVSSTSNIAVGEWSHLAGTYDGSNLRIYVNGVMEASVFKTGLVNNNLEDLRIGTTGPATFDGSLDEIALYNRSLTSEELQQHYDKGLDGSGYEITTLTGEMKDLFGVDFSEDFALEMDFNKDLSSGVTNLQVLKDFNNPNNPVVNPVDQDALNDQQYFLSSFNTSDVTTAYLAIEKLEHDLILDPIGLDPINFGHVNGSVPFQSLIQHYKNNGEDVLVANTFRGYMAYSITPDDLTLDSTDQIYLGYTLVESHFLDKLNSYLGNAGFSEIPPYGFEPIYDPATGTFGMKYTEIFVVWQDTADEAPDEVKALGLGDLRSFEGVVQGENVIAASLFEYLTFTYKISTRQEGENTIVDVTTEYSIGPMKWLITRDDAATYSLIDTFSPIISSGNSFNVPAEEVTIYTTWEELPSYTINIPSLSFYTSSAIPVRLDGDAMMNVEGANSYGISVVTSTNIIKMTSESFVEPTPITDGNGDLTIPLQFGDETVYETSFVGKDTYDRISIDGTVETGLPVYISTRDMDQVGELINLDVFLNSYFEAQIDQTEGFVWFAANQLSDAFQGATTEQLRMAVADGSVTLIQMPQWSGFEVIQDPVYSAIADIYNLPPEIISLSGPLDPIVLGTDIQMIGVFADPDQDEFHTTIWDWGDGTTTIGTVDQVNDIVTGTHAYSSPGVYTVNLTITDDDGESASKFFRYVVIYDPEGSFVTGGGWFTSPEGAYIPDSTLTGKATFGFVSKYKKGTTEPTGKTTFVLHVSDFHFQSESYDWLVVAGSKAQFKGTGTINGDGSYGFLVTAWDGNLNGDLIDKFRIKIWDKETDVVIYDNQLGADDSSDSATVIEGGSITIHDIIKMRN